MNKLQIFTHSDLGQVRIVEVDNEPWFVGKDVAEILGYERTTKSVVDHVDEDDRQMIDSKTQSQIGIELGQRGGWLINESGLYSLILSSKLPRAKEFKWWVTSEVLPSIRKYGGYIAEQETLTDDELFARALQLAQRKLAERDKRVHQLETKTAQQAQIIGELKPKADYTDRILQSKGLLTTTQIAKDYGMSGGKLNSILHDMKIQYKQNGQWLLYSNYQSCGYTHSQTIDITRSDGRPDTTMQTKWTQKGRLFLYEKLKKKGILPMIER